MALNGVYRMRIHCRLHGQEHLNVLHFKDEVGYIGNGSLDLAIDFRDNLGTTLRGRATTDMAFEYVEVVPLIPYGGGPEVASWPANTLGTRTGTTGTGSACEVVTLYTAEIGRRNRGRMYLSGGSFTSMALGQWAAAQTTSTQAFVTALLNRYIQASTATAWTIGVWSRVIAGPDPPYNSDGFTPITSATVRTLVRNQRRRQIGVGR